jgi:recombinational DNA repair protein (RecF pathway)
MKRRAHRPGDPTRFSVRLSRENLKRLDRIHRELRLDNRNATLNFIVQNFQQSQDYDDFVRAIRRVVREELDEYATKKNKSGG